MFWVRRTTLVKKALDEVFGYLSDLTHHSEWDDYADLSDTTYSTEGLTQSGTREVTIEAGPGGTRSGPATVKRTLRILERVTNELLYFEEEYFERDVSTDELHRLWYFRLQPSNGFTKITKGCKVLLSWWRFLIPPGLGLVVWSFFWPFQQFINPWLDQGKHLGRIKKQLES